MPFLELTSAEAIKHIKENTQHTTDYAIAKALSTEFMKVQAIQVANWSSGKKMSKRTSYRFKEVFDIEITDVYKPAGRPSEW